MKIVIVDDEFFVRMGIKAVVNQMSDCEIVGEAENGEDAVSVILETQPDLVFLDITMPRKDGLEVLKDVREQHYQGHIIFLTSYDDFKFVQQALRDGANDYVLKNELVGDKMIDYIEKSKKKSKKSHDQSLLMIRSPSIVKKITKKIF